MYSRVCITLALCFASSIGLNAAAREWRDVTGRYSRQAEFVALQGGTVQLKLADGRSAKVPLDKLSVADQAHIAEVTKSKVLDPFVTMASSEVKMVQAVLQSQQGALSETLPPPETAATFAAMQDMEAAAGEEAVDYRRIRKFVYYGSHSTTHLIDLGPTSGFGTIHYCLGHHHHDSCDHGCCDHSCCGSHCTWYLAYLRKYKEDDHFLYYRPLFVAPYIDLWAFAKHPTCGGCKYRIWYRVRATGKWYRFDCASRVHPK